MPIRVLVVEDSLTIRRYLVDALASDPGFEVVGEAADGRQAIDLCTALRPDVVSMDMMLPVMTGLAATEHIMAYCPTPILVVSASLNRGEVFRTYDALAAGAVDVLEKPDGQSLQAWPDRYRQMLRIVSRIRVITHPRARLPEPGGRPALSRSLASAPTGAHRCVAIGASTGGPAAAARLLGALPADFPLPILLVIHIGAPFGGSLTEWLDTVSTLRVRNAVDGEPLPPPGRPGVVMAPPDVHLAVHRGRLRTLSTPERHFCRPSVDVLFESLAREMGEQVVAALLTGMGRDGAGGLLAVRRAGGLTIAQDEASSVVYGMPREAVQLDAARHVLPLDQIAPALVRLAEGGRESRGGRR